MLPGCQEAGVEPSLQGCSEDFGLGAQGGESHDAGLPRHAAGARSNRDSNVDPQTVSPLLGDCCQRWSGRPTSGVALLPNGPEHLQQAQATIGVLGDDEYGRLIRDGLMQVAERLY